jgi:hypothetical protein
MIKMNNGAPIVKTGNISVLSRICCRNISSGVAYQLIKSFPKRINGTACGESPMALNRLGRLLGDCPNFRVNENGTVPFSANLLGQGG